MAAAGLTQTADTGQVNWVTVTRPGVSTNGGFEIWRFNDTAHATAPIFIRIDYGTGTAATRPRLQLTVGTGSNGSGTITGSVLAATTVSSTGGAAVGGAFTNYVNYDATQGFLLLVQAAGLATTGLAQSGFLINRTVDNTGAPTVTGCVIGYHNGGNTIAADAHFIPVRFAATAAVYQDLAGCAFCTPTNEAVSTVGSDVQNFLAFMPTPRIAPLHSVCAALLAELGEGSTATMQTVGSGTATFLNIGKELGEVASASLSSITIRFGLCVLWQ